MVPELVSTVYSTLYIDSLNNSAKDRLATAKYSPDSLTVRKLKTSAKKALTATAKDNAITIFNQKSADSVISFVESDHPIAWNRKLDNDNRVPMIKDEPFSNRQEHNSTYHPNGAIYVLTKEMVMSDRFYSKNTFAYLMPRERSIDIDDLFQFKFAEFLAKSQ